MGELVFPFMSLSLNWRKQQILKRVCPHVRSCIALLQINRKPQLNHVDNMCDKNHNDLIEFVFIHAWLEWSGIVGRVSSGSATRCLVVNASVDHLSELHADDARRIKVGTPATPNMSGGQMAGGPWQDLHTVPHRQFWENRVHSKIFLGKF